VRGVRAEVLADHRLGRLLHPECGDDRERGDARADRVRRDPGRAAGDRYEAHHEHADQFAHSALATEGSPTATTSRTTEIDGERVAGEPERVPPDPRGVREYVNESDNAGEYGTEGAPATPSSGTGPTPKMSAGAATRLTRTLTTLTWRTARVSP